MRAVDIIERKRDSHELTREEIQFFVAGFTSDEIPDYQASAWAMAVLIRGMTPRETTDLTLAMVDSGETLDLSEVVDFVVDKHSTGGVGDKTSLVVAPLVSACGLPVGKMSGRGLGYSGGTLDKLESIPGYRVDLTTEEFLAQLAEIGIVLTGQTKSLAPADGKLYALRDVTGTVPSVPLIASSVMSKKIAAGAQAIVLDVKAGTGAFMPTVAAARELAELMVQIGDLAGRKTVALISEMNQPLGHAVGNALEVREAIETLQGEGPEDFREHCLAVASHMLVLGSVRPDLDAAADFCRQILAGGKALDRFKALAAAQGGDISYIEQPDKLPKAALVEAVPSPGSGWLSRIDARTVGVAAVALGAGRAKKGDPIDLAVGFEMHHKVGDRVEVGDPLFTVHADDPEKLAAARESVLGAHAFSSEPVDPLPLFHGVIA